MLPIESVLPELHAALARRPRAVLIAPPGAGKTTRVPLALLDAPWLAGRKIVMLEPRRLAARAAAARMARTLGEPVGETVGYRIRLDRRVGARTRIEVVTEGILTRMLTDDPSLDGIGAVLFDEFHERSLAADTGLALTLGAAVLLRDDLRVLVMSATLDGGRVAALLGGAPVVESTGRAFPVETRHVPPRPGARLEPHVAQVIREALATETGSILAFLPGAGEIRRVEGMLLDGALPPDVRIHPLHGQLAGDVQDAAIAPAPHGRRKVVLATTIAETSLTIEGVRIVVDGGEMRVPRFSPRTGMTRLETIRVSRASADQRRGRAGRTEPGVCLRCWSAADDAGLVPFTRAEMLDADLAPLALDLAAAGFADPLALPWLDPPPAAAFAQARALLTLLGALDDAGRLTPHGRAMAALGAHPRLGHLMLRAKAMDPATAARAAALAALLEERDPLRGEGGRPPADLRLRLDAVERDADRGHALGGTLDGGGVARIRDLAAEWRRRLGTGRDAPREAEAPGLLVALAYPDRVAQQRGGPGRFLLRNGRGATLPTDDAMAHEPWLAVAALDDAGRDARIALAAPIDIDALLAHGAAQVTTEERVVWDDEAQAVSARRRTLLGALVLADHHLSHPDPVRVREALEEGIRRAGPGVLPWSDGAATLRHRLAFLHRLDPSWPDVSDAALLETLDDWLGPHLDGVRRLEALARVDLGAALLERLPWERRRRLDELAPERFTVPSGSAIAIDYADPAAPVLAVRLQEVFGLLATPRIGGGAVPLVIHLLSPAYRPVQVTRDLASFWTNGYFDVRKDLRGRYPRHAWPEDPLQAPAQRGPKRRG